MKKHGFTVIIRQILQQHFEVSEEILSRGELLQYINAKTESFNKGAKARANFGNLYAIYVLVEDYSTYG